MFEPCCPDCGAGLRAVLVTEDAPLDPLTAYAVSKVAQEQLAAVWARLTGGSVVALRYHNVYGPRMPRDTPYSGVAAIFRSALEAGLAPRVFEDGAQQRDFVHAEASRPRTCWRRNAGQPGQLRAYNIASGEPQTIGQMAKALASALSGPEPVVTGEFRPGDVRHIVASPARARSELGFVPRTGFDAGMDSFAHAPLRKTERAVQPELSPGRSPAARLLRAGSRCLRRSCRRPPRRPRDRPGGYPPQVSVQAASGPDDLGGPAANRHRFVRITGALAPLRWRLRDGAGALARQRRRTNGDSVIGHLYEQALAGAARPEIEYSDGHAAPLNAQRWLRELPGDRSLLSRCAGPALRRRRGTRPPHDRAGRTRRSRPGHRHHPVCRRPRPVVWRAGAAAGRFRRPAGYRALGHGPACGWQHRHRRRSGGPAAQGGAPAQARWLRRGRGRGAGHCDPAGTRPPEDHSGGRGVVSVGLGGR